MTPPVLSGFAARLYAEVEPLAYDDAAHGYALAHYCAAIGAQFQAVEDLSRDTDAGPGWTSILDLARAPDFALTWLGQLAGVRRLPNSTDAQHRARIAGTDGFQRGTVAALKAAARLHLTGTQAAIVRERFDSGSPGDHAYRLEVVTYIAETPDPAAVLAALIEQKPAGLVLRYRTIPGADYAAVLSRGTYAAARAAFPSYEGMRSALPSNVN